MNVARYEDFKPNIRPLDLVCFSGKDFVSRFIRHIQRRKLHKCNDFFETEQGVLTKKIKNKKKYSFDEQMNDPGRMSHVGIVISSEILDYEYLEKSKLYVLESTMSGPFGQGVRCVEGFSFLGVQLRELDLVVEEYNKSRYTKVAFAPLIEEIDLPALKPKFTEFFKKVNHTIYDANLVSLLSAIYRRFRVFRNFTEKLTRTEDWLFCSELVAFVLVELGLLPSCVNPKNVVPMNFLGFCGNCHIPKIYGDPILITNRDHKRFLKKVLSHIVVI